MYCSGAASISDDGTHDGGDDDGRDFGRYAEYDGYGNDYETYSGSVELPLWDGIGRPAHAFRGVTAAEAASVEQAFVGQAVRTIKMAERELKRRFGVRLRTKLPPEFVPPQTPASR